MKGQLVLLPKLASQKVFYLGELEFPILYHDILEHVEPERELYLAIRRAVYLDIFTEPIGKVLLDKKRLRLVVFDPTSEVIVQWIP